MAVVLVVGEISNTNMKLQSVEMSSPENLWDIFLFRLDLKNVQIYDYYFPYKY